MIEQTSRDTSVLTLRAFRIAIAIVFFVMIGRLYQLQVVSYDEYENLASQNSVRRIELPADRGVIYDRNRAILTRNQPSFEIALIPEYLTVDDIETEADEESIEIERILTALRADSSEEVAIRIAEIMFRRLGRSDYAETIESVNITLPTIYVPGPGGDEAADDSITIGDSSFVPVPDITKPLPLPALVALVQRAVTLGRQGKSAEPIPIMDLVDRIRAFEVSEDRYRFPSLQINEVPVRDYVYGEKVSHVLGFMGPIPAEAADFYAERGYTNINEKVGLSGLEFQYQDELRGIPGERNIVVDILGRETETFGEIVPPVAGQHLYLNIDYDLQSVMYDELQAMMIEKDAPWGVTIAMDPQTGAILGMVSLPSFDNNVFSEALGQEYLLIQNNELKPLINYAIGGLYPPGSVFKMATAAAALEEEIVNADTTITDSGPIYLPNRFFPDDPSQAQEFVSWNHKYGINHGPINLVQALALSNDIYFYLVGGGWPPTQLPGLGDQKIKKWAEDFGYGPTTGIDIPGEVNGLVPDDQWKRQTRAERWTTGDSYNISIGQGDLLATPLQVLVATAAVANGGTVYQPQIVHEIRTADNELIRGFEPNPLRRLPMSDATVRSVQQGMWAAVNHDFGTAIDSKIEGVTVAGKTGTAEFCAVDQNPDIPVEERDCLFRDEKDNLPTHAWYVAYAPFEDPEIAVVSFLYRGGEGSDAALPVARNIMEYYFTQVNPPGRSEE